MSLNAPTKPFENTRMAEFLRKRIEELANRKSQREIAAQAGYERPNIFSMFKYGDTKVPFDKVPAIAAALEVDPVFLLRLQLDQPGGFDTQTVQKLTDRMTTENEKLSVLDPWREIVGSADVKLSVEQRKRLTAFLQELMAEPKKAANS
ncbi:XRE family transcriptional regulator [Methylobacterium sp. AMS5]|uniref:XRE family transcriptional regulator n=1 Tax=Methylobacterium sp. AMS5 TaxID=925818 RepID=UPI00074F918B|nr:XRE family transcriptional regulator [Methylobacterium sp. AMS5]AMB48384.1 hypothetical protein Y590_25785 [Methylobacterium sp. AMS5]